MKNPLQTFVRLAGDLITDFLNASLFYTTSSGDRFITNG